MKNRNFLVSSIHRKLIFGVLQYFHQILTMLLPRLEPEAQFELLIEVIS